MYELKSVIYNTCFQKGTKLLFFFSIPDFLVIVGKLVVDSLL